MTDPMFAATPEPPYFAVIFTSLRAGSRKAGSGDGYEPVAERMRAIAADQPGFLGMESVRADDGFGITVSYWSSEEAIAAWKAHAEHQLAQAAGRRTWYADFQLRIAKVTRAYGKSRA